MRFLLARRALLRRPWAVIQRLLQRGVGPELPRLEGAPLRFPGQPSATARTLCSCERHRQRDPWLESPGMCALSQVCALFYTDGEPNDASGRQRSCHCIPLMGPYLLASSYQSRGMRPSSRISRELWCNNCWRIQNDDAATTRLGKIAESPSSIRGR